VQSEYEEFRHQAVHALMALNQRCECEFRIGSWERWEYDLEPATLTFFENGLPRIVASIVVVGSTSFASSTWLWAWGNSSIPEECRKGMEQVRQLGETRQFSLLGQDKITDDEYLGWELTAIAASVLGAKGAYRCPSERGFLYVIYDEIAFLA